MTKPLPSTQGQQRRDIDPLSPSGDKRRRRRTRSLLSGVVTYNNGAESLSCTVRNFSKTGACVAVPPGVTFPDRLFLIIVRHRIAHEAVVMWYDKHQAGLKFERSITLDDRMDHRLAYLTELWRENAPR